MTNKIFILDDEIDLLKILELRIKKAGYEVESSTNANDALNKLKEGHFDLLLLDLIMPQITGFEFYEKIKQEPSLKDLAIIILTADATKETEKKIKKMNVANYIKKPFEADELLKSISQAIKK